MSTHRPIECQANSVATPWGFSRRQFLQRLTAGGLVAGCGLLSFSSRGAADTWDCQVGVCNSSAQWDLIRKAGCSYVEENVGKLLNPTQEDGEFAKAAEQFKTKGIPVRACNGFLPKELKLVGPEARPDAVVEYASKALERAKLLGIQIVVLGSGGARNVPAGFERSRAEEQFVQVVRRLGQAAATHGVTMAMESLNRSETNFGNTLGECLKLIKSVNHPRVCLVADMYHMLKENEGAEVILEAGSKLVHCHIAEKAQRTPPGTDGDDFKAYLRALKKLGFRGGISLECRWKNFSEELAPAVAALKKQIEAVRAEA